MTRILHGSALGLTLLALVPAMGAEPDDIAAGYLAAPKAFRAASQVVLPSLVRIEISGGVVAPPRVPEAKPLGPRPKDGPAAKPKPADTAPGAKPKPTPRRPHRRGISAPGEGPTTGVIVSADGHIITSTYNFLRQSPIITVILHDGTQHVARLLGRDETRKLCLLKIDGVKHLPAARPAPVGTLRIGQWAVAMGVGYGGDEPALSAGIVSALGRMSGRAVQTDANTSPANYGGPLVDLDGRVIGICVPLSPMSEETAGGVEWYDSGIGFAVPLDGLDRILEDMKQGKVIQPGKLGIAVRPGPAGKDAEITSVAEGSPAAKAGLQPKDVITTIDGQAVVDVRKLRSILGRYVAGEKIKVAAKRGEKTVEVEVTLAPGTDIAPPRPAMPVQFKP